MPPSLSSSQLLIRYHTFHAFNFDKYAKRYLAGFCFRFNRRFEMVGMTERIANAVCGCKPCPQRALRVAEV